MSKIIKDTQSSTDKVKETYRTRNWEQYNTALVSRGNITIYFTKEAIANWYAEGEAQRGGQYLYSDLCIESMLMLKVVFKLGYRQTQGFTQSLLDLMDLGQLNVPSYSQLCRRSETLKFPRYKIPKSGSINIVIDSTGLKVYGEGEWKVRKHGYSKRRIWRKLHLGTDPKTGFIHCDLLTDHSTSDGSQLAPLLDQVDHNIDAVPLDGAYDHEDCWDELIEREINPIIPPRKGAVEWFENEEGDLADYPRNVAIRQIEETDRKQWKIESGYHQRSLAETAMFRYKTIHGEALYSRKMKTQQTESRLKTKVLNIMTAQGMPVSEILKSA
jgi:hypothetical protein